jgi:spermidine/putrescine transport system substrate-binding protein
MIRCLLYCCLVLSLLGNQSYAALQQQVLNVYMWANWVPPQVLAQFTRETGIKVNFATYESNEILYAKLSAGKNPGYDIIAPSSFYIKRMVEANLLAVINHHRLSNFMNVDHNFLHQAYDYTNSYSIPFAWGVTGIFYNDRYFKPGTIKSWQDLWQQRYKQQLLLLDDPRDVLTMALLSQGYSANDENPAHIHQAYRHLKKLLNNVKLFNVDAVSSILIDEDATIGMAWNGDVFRARQENQHLHFVFPQEGFAIWLDCLSIAKNAPHLDNAYKFINFLLQPAIAKVITSTYGFATANTPGQKSLPLAMRQDPTITIPARILKNGVINDALAQPTINLYEKYWELLKI